MRMFQIHPQSYKHWWIIDPDAHTDVYTLLYNRTPHSRRAPRTSSHSPRSRARYFAQPLTRRLHIYTHRQKHTHTHPHNTSTIYTRNTQGGSGRRERDIMALARAICIHYTPLPSRARPSPRPPLVFLSSSFLTEAERVPRSRRGTFLRAAAACAH